MVQVGVNAIVISELLASSAERMGGSEGLLIGEKGIKETHYLNDFDDKTTVKKSPFCNIHYFVRMATPFYTECVGREVDAEIVKLAIEKMDLQKNGTQLIGWYRFRRLRHGVPPNYMLSDLEKAVHVGLLAKIPADDRSNFLFLLGTEATGQGNSRAICRWNYTPFTLVGGKFVVLRLKMWNVTQANRQLVKDAIHYNTHSSDSLNTPHSAYSNIVAEIGKNMKGADGEVTTVTLDDAHKLDEAMSASTKAAVDKIIEQKKELAKLDQEIESLENILKQENPALGEESASNECMTSQQLREEESKLKDEEQPNVSPLSSVFSSSTATAAPSAHKSISDNDDVVMIEPANATKVSPKKVVETEQSMSMDFETTIPVKNCAENTKDVSSVNTPNGEGQKDGEKGEGNKSDIDKLIDAKMCEMLNSMSPNPK